MANDSIDRVQIRQFSERVHADAQQLLARLRGKTQMKNMTGDDYAYDGIGTVEAREILGRSQDVVFDDVVWNRRQLRRRRFQVALPIDASDVRGMIANPTSEFIRTISAAMMRRFDRTVIERMFADVQTGREFENTVTATADGVVTVDATAGLTYAKLLEVHENFINNEVGNDFEEELVMGITGKEHTTLMQELNLTSRDFTKHFVVDKGRITQAAGIQLIVFGANPGNPMLPVVGGTRTSFAMSTRAMCVGMSLDIETKVQDRNDLVETNQVVAVFELDAVRTEGKLIQRVTTTV